MRPRERRPHRRIPAPTRVTISEVGAWVEAAFVRRRMEAVVAGAVAGAALAGPAPAGTLAFTEAPTEGTVWPVGAWRDVAWEGAAGDPVDILLSVDDGVTFDLLFEDWTFAGRRLQVPDRPTTGARLRIVADDPPRVADTPRFTIDDRVILTSLEVVSGPLGADTFQLRWGTEPAAPDLRGYRVETRAPGGGWSTLAAEVRTTSLLTPTLPEASSFRLWALNGLGGEVLLGEAATVVRGGIDVWPQPLRSGTATLRVRSAHPPGSVVVIDPAGRRVATLDAPVLSGEGHHLLRWDGRDARGHDVPSGVYRMVAIAGHERPSGAVLVLR